VEVPTERRVKRWGLSVQELVKDPIGRQVLETFLESEFSSENIRFWIAIQDLKYSPNDQIDHKTERIYEEFLAPGAPAQVNVDSRTLDQTLDCLQKATTASTRRHAFTHSEEHVFTLMAKDSYPRFVRSQIYKVSSAASKQPDQAAHLHFQGVLSAAQQQGSRRLGWRNFIFNMGAAKKPQCKPAKTRDELHSQNLPKQLSSDSLPVRTAHAVR
ncbi:regulator of G protein signaling domain protein, partial [Ancylostoma duodenale]